MKAVNPKITSFFTSKGNLGVKRPCEDEDSDSENSKNNQPQVPICNDVISTDISLFVNRRLSDEEKLLVRVNYYIDYRTIGNQNGILTVQGFKKCMEAPKKL